jgi:hypothetical protein
VPPALAAALNAVGGGGGRGGGGIVLLQQRVHEALHATLALRVVGCQAVKGVACRCGHVLLGGGGAAGGQRCGACLVAGCCAKATVRALLLTAWLLLRRRLCGLQQLQQALRCILSVVPACEPVTYVSGAAVGQHTARSQVTCSPCVEAAGHSSHTQAQHTPTHTQARTTRAAITLR